MGDGGPLGGWGSSRGDRELQEEDGPYDGPKLRGHSPRPRPNQYHFAPGTTAVLSQTVKPLTLELLEEAMQAMEVE